MTRFNSFRVLIALTIFTTYALWNLVAWAISQPVEMGDTYRYFGFQILDAQNPGITTSLLYQSVQDPQILTFIQVVLATCAFLLLAGVVLIQTQWRVAGLIASALVLLIFMTAFMTAPLRSWQTLLATEGVTMSFSIIWLATIIIPFNRER